MIISFGEEPPNPGGAAQCNSGSPVNGLDVDRRDIGWERRELAHSDVLWRKKATRVVTYSKAKVI